MNMLERATNGLVGKQGIQCDQAQRPSKQLKLWPMLDDPFFETKTIGETETVSDIDADARSLS